MGWLSSIRGHQVCQSCCVEQEKVGEHDCLRAENFVEHECGCRCWSEGRVAGEWV